MVNDGDSMSVEGPPSPGENAPVSDFSGLHGFQFVVARDSVASEGEEERRAALTVELEARAARFHQAVDSSIVLSSDGAIRWLGDTVAKLAAGDDPLAPRAILLADEAMSESARTVAATRLDLWVNATVQRHLGPLFALRSLQDGGKPLQDLAAKIADALGVLEREPVRNIVRGLDQNARAVLRKLGVRFGSYYLYVPATLRPAARALALQLWSLRKGGEDFSVAVQSLMPMASSGRTSAPPDPRIGAEAYRLGGFRMCGDRVVRVDIVERLADMIRAASNLRVANEAKPGPAAFQVTGQMTSLTGCSGEGFASILKALGFESLSVRRDEIIMPAAATPVAAPPEGSADAAAPEGAGSAEDAPEAEADEAESSAPVPADELAETDVSEPATEEAAAETDAETAETDAEAAEPEPEAVSAADESASLSIVAVELEETPPEAPGEDSPAEPETDVENAAEADAPGSAIEHEAAAPEAPGEDSPAEPETDVENAAKADALGSAIEPEATAADATAPDGEPSTEAAEAGAAAPPAAETEMVTLWRFVRAPHPHHARGARPPRRGHAQPAPGPQDAGARPAEGDGERRKERHPRDKRRAPENAAPPAAPKTWDIKKAWDAKQAQRANERSREERPPRPVAEKRPPVERRPTVDPTSPFAKLMELRSKLESESKRRN